LNRFPYFRREAWTITGGDEFRGEAFMFYPLDALDEFRAAIAVDQREIVVRVKRS
jgi:hypothetical protein